MTSVDAVVVRWPSGFVQRFEDLKINRTYEFTEGHEGCRDVYAEAAFGRLVETEMEEVARECGVPEMPWTCGYQPRLFRIT